MSYDLRARNRRRLEYLRALYDLVDSSVTDFVEGFELGLSLEMDLSETRRVLGYLSEKGLVKVDDFRSGVIRLTAAGVDFVERANSESPG
jgi:hypothetical protein